MLTAGIETKRQQSMKKGEREDFMLTEYLNWVEIIQQQHSNADVGPYLEYTTGTHATKVTGIYLYRNFTEGLRMFHKDFVPVWNKVFAGQISCKSPDELCFFFVICWIAVSTMRNRGIGIPRHFLLTKSKKQNGFWHSNWWSRRVKPLVLATTNVTSHEFLANPTGYVSFCVYIYMYHCWYVFVVCRVGHTRNRYSYTQDEKSCVKKLGRKAHREGKAKSHRETIVDVSASKHTTNAFELGHIQTVINLMKMKEKQTNAR